MQDLKFGARNRCGDRAPAVQAVQLLAGPGAGPFLAVKRPSPGDSTHLVIPSIDDATRGCRRWRHGQCLRQVGCETFFPDVVQLIPTAINPEVDGLIIPEWVPGGEDPVIKDAFAARITAMGGKGGKGAR